MRSIHMARIRDETPSEFHRILVDRLWPRGVRKDQALWDEWLPEVAPSTQLRRYCHSHRNDIKIFRTQYIDELQNNTSSQLEQLLHMVQIASVVLLTASHDIERSQVPILREFLEQGVHPFDGRQNSS